MSENKKDPVLKSLLTMAKQYGVDKNKLFLSVANQYALEQQIISKIKETIDSDEMLTTKEYVKGRENIYVNPLVKELPKHTDAANKTATVMLNVIKQFGQIAKPVDQFAKTLSDLEKDFTS